MRLRVLGGNNVEFGGKNFLFYSTGETLSAPYNI